jgi:concentrative nucleoside transporter, CNT family
MTLQFQSLLGLAVFPLIAWALSENRAAHRASRIARILLAGLGLQFGLAALLLHVPPSRAAFDAVGGLVASLQEATNTGTRLVFGYLAGAPAPFETVRPEYSFVLALQALPLVLLISALSKLLYHWGILQRVVAAIGWGLRRAFGISGAIGTSAAANIFVGMVEAPLFVRPYLAKMSRAGLFATMTVGMATIAGTVLALYATILEPVMPGAAGHLIVASVISAPAALMIAGLMVPESPAQSTTNATRSVATEIATRSSIDAIAEGTREGVVLLVNVTAMLIVIVALIALANQFLGWIGEALGLELTLEAILGVVFVPFAWLIGIPWKECTEAGTLIGIKTVLNELIAFLRLAEVGPAELSERSRLLLTYALCGFANFGSLGIMLGGMTAMVPERRAEIVGLGLKTIVSGTLATLMTAAVVGVLTAT